MKKCTTTILYIITIAIFLFTPLVAYKKTVGGQTFPLTTPQHKYLITLWHIDTFEGGIGSRADFLSTVALNFNYDGVLIMVVNHTIESARTSIENGNIPDIISYGVGADFVAKYAKELNKSTFKGGENCGKFYAYAWCRGGYYLISKSDDKRPIERLIVSQNAYNLPFGAIYLDGVEGKEVDFFEPIKAYTEFLQDKNGFMIGTQRDLWRLQRRGVEVFACPLENFCDLFQYVSITSTNDEKARISEQFLNYLLSDKVQNKITEIGMFPIKFNPYSGLLGDYDLQKTQNTISPFVQNQVITDMVEITSVNKITNDSLLKFKNMLKRLK